LSIAQFLKEKVLVSWERAFRAALVTVGYSIRWYVAGFILIIIGSIIEGLGAFSEGCGYRVFADTGKSEEAEGSDSGVE
jgi:hypothetical protein